MFSQCGISTETRAASANEPQQMPGNNILSSKDHELYSKIGMLHVFTSVDSGECSQLKQALALNQNACCYCCDEERKERRRMKLERVLESNFSQWCPVRFRRCVSQ